MKTYRVTVNVTDELMPHVFGLFQGDERASKLKVDEITSRQRHRKARVRPEVRTHKGNGRTNLTAAERRHIYGWVKPYWESFQPLFADGVQISVLDDRITAIVERLGLSRRSQHSLISGFEVMGHLKRNKRGVYTLAS